MSVVTVLEHDSLQVKSERMVDNEMEDGSSTRQVDTSHWMLADIVHWASQYMDHKRRGSSCQLLIKLSTSKLNNLNLGGNETIF